MYRLKRVTRRVIQNRVIISNLKATTNRRDIKKKKIKTIPNDAISSQLIGKLAHGRNIINAPYRLEKFENYRAFNTSMSAILPIRVFCKSFGLFSITRR